MFGSRHDSPHLVLGSDAVTTHDLDQLKGGRTNPISAVQDLHRLTIGAHNDSETADIEGQQAHLVKVATQVESPRFKCRKSIAQFKQSAFGPAHPPYGLLIELLRPQVDCEMLACR